MSLLSRILPVVPVPTALTSTHGNAGSESRSLYVESDFKDLHAHMTACAQQGFLGSFHCNVEKARLWMVPRLVMSVGIAAAIGFALGAALHVLVSA